MRIPLVAILLCAIATPALAQKFKFKKVTITTQGRAVMGVTVNAGAEPTPAEREQAREAAVRAARTEVTRLIKETPGAVSHKMTLKGIRHGVRYEAADHPTGGNRASNSQTPVAFTEMTFRVRLLADGEVDQP